MASVESKVVSMKFDNKGFESGVSGTISMLDKLKSSLNFTGAKSSLEELKASGKNFSLEGMQSAPERVSASFLAMATIGITALANITNKAVDSGIAIAKAFTLEPMRQGFAEYETNMNSIQTIMANTASKGSTLTDVNNSLEQLNIYSDKTIYNFSEMAKNIGTFTSAGVDLDTSVRSIKGIANLAAVSGSSSQQASTAMYQLSQAISTGTLKLMDWNSVTNAGMGGEIFKTRLFETGKALGTLTDVPVNQTFAEWEKANGSFRESLESGWITTDVLTTSLAAMTGEMSTAELVAKGFSDAQIVEIQKIGEMATKAATEIKTATQLVDVVKEAIGSGWSTTFRMIIGDFEEAKNVMTVFGNAVSDAVSKQAAARNDILNGWKVFGGRQALLEGLIVGLSLVLDIIRPVKEAFREVFPRKTVTQLLEMTNAFTAFMVRLKMGEDSLTSIKNIFKGVFSIVAIVIEVIKGMASVIGDVLGAFDGAGGGVLKFAGGIGLAINKVREFLVEGGALKTYFDIVGKVLSAPITAISAFVGLLKDLFGTVLMPLFGALGTVFTAVFGSITTTVGGVTGAFGPITGFFASLYESVQNFAATIPPIMLRVQNAILSTIDPIKSFAEKIPPYFAIAGEAIASTYHSIAGFFGQLPALLAPVKELFAAFSDAIAEFGGKLPTSLGQVKDAFTSLGDPLMAFKDQITSIFGSNGDGGATTKGATRTAAAIDMVRVSFTSMNPEAEKSSSIIDKLKTFFESIWGYVKGLGETLKGVAGGVAQIFQASSDGVGKAFNSDFFQDILNNLDKVFIAGIFVLLAKVLFRMFKLSSEFKELIGSVNKTLDAVTETLGAMQQKVKAEAIFKIAAAMAVLTISLIAISFLNTEQLVHGLAGIAAGMILLVTAMSLMGKFTKDMNSKDLLKISVAMIAMGAGVLLLSMAMVKLSTLKWEELGVGLAGVTAGLIILTLAAKTLSGDNKNLISAGIAMSLFSLGLLALAKVIERYAEFEWDTVYNSMGKIALALAVLVAAMTLMPSEDMVGLGIGFTIFAYGLQKMLGVIQTWAKVKWEVIKDGLKGIAATLAVLVIAFALMPNNMVEMGAGLILVGAALWVMAVALQKVASIDLKQMAGAVLALIGVLAMLTLAILVMKAAQGGAAALIIAAGALYILAVVLEKVGNLGMDVIKVGLLGIALVIGVLAAAALLMIPLGVPMMAFGIALLLIGAGFAAFGGGAILVAKALPVLAKATQESIGIILDILEEIIKAMPRFVGAFAQAILDLIVGVLEGIPEVIDTFGDILLKILAKIVEIAPKIADALIALIDVGIRVIREKGPEFITLGFEMLMAFLSGLRDNIQEIVILGTDIILRLIDGIAEKVPDIIETGITLIVSLLDGIAAGLPRIIIAGTNLILQFLYGLTVAIPLIIAAATNLITSFITAVGNSVNAIIDAGVNMLLSFISGLTNNVSRIVGAVTILILTFIFEIGNSAIMIAQAGTDTIVAFLDAMGENIEEIATSVGDFLTNIINAIAGQIKKVTDAGTDAAVDFLKGMAKNVKRVTDQAAITLAVIMDAVATSAISMVDSATKALFKFLDAMGDRAEENTGEMVRKVGRIAKGIITGLIKGLTDTVNLDAVKDALKNLVSKAVDGVLSFLGINSPSKVFIGIAASMAEGLVDGANADTTAERAIGNLAGRTVESFRETMKALPALMADIDQFNPVIAPVLDLTNVESEAQRLGGFFAGQSVMAEVSTGNAKLISTVTAESSANADVTPVAAQVPTEIIFNQTINAPKALSTNDIYNNTRGQIAIAKEELSIL